MTPPINIDGATVDAITMDGDNVSGVTVDGDPVFSAVPDSVVSRPADDDSFSDTRKFGLVFQSDDSWPEIGAEISANTASVTRAYIYRRSDDTLLNDKDVSSLTGGDTFTITANIQANTEYMYILDAEGATYTVGLGPSVSYPVVSGDGRLEITAMVNGGLSGSISQSSPPSIRRIGNVGFS